MAQRIEGPTDDLFHRHDLRQVRVKDGKVGKYTHTWHEGTEKLSLV
jgi:hypothetical protein